MNINAISKTINTALKKIEPQSNVIVDLASDCVQSGTRYGKHKVKRYLYHLTTETNYKNILKSGKINTSQDSYLDYEGVFLTELENIGKYWRTSNDWNKALPKNKDGIYLSLGLLGQVSKGTRKVICLRIPTKYLDHDMLKIRSQNKLCKSSLSEEIIPHIETGAPAKDANLYKQRKEAIEYIYQGAIPVEQIELVGMSDIPKLSLKSLQTWTKDEQKNIVLNVFKKLFTGQPESKGLDAMF